LRSTLREQRADNERGEGNNDARAQQREPMRCYRGCLAKQAVGVKRLFSVKALFTRLRSAKPVF
jgi:hypothetical protein